MVLLDIGKAIKVRVDASHSVIRTKDITIAIKEIPVERGERTRLVTGACFAVKAAVTAEIRHL